LTRTRQDDVGGELVRTLEACWVRIRARHHDLPPAVLVTGSGTLGVRSGLRLGHFAASRWQGAGDGSLAEVFIGGEGAARGARDVLATLLHEATHALADQRGVKDTSRQGRYHNRRFKALAAELGLHVVHDPSLGWSPTTLTDATAAVYAQEIAALDAALTAYRMAEPLPPPRRPGSVACVCTCARRIRIAPSVLALGLVICAVCGDPFEPDARGGVTSRGWWLF
jgi:hypothetical protein